MRRVFVPVFLATMASAIGLTLAQAQPPQPPQSPPPAPDAGTPGANPPADPAMTLINDRCAMCHDASLVTSMRRSPAAWNDLVHSMMRKGATLSDDEAAQVIAYLSKAYGDPPAGS